MLVASMSAAVWAADTNAGSSYKVRYVPRARRPLQLAVNRSRVLLLAFSKAYTVWFVKYMPGLDPTRFSCTGISMLEAVFSFDI